MPTESELSTRVHLRLTRAALERLIGDEPNIEVTLTHATVKALSEKWSKPLLQRLERCLSEGINLQDRSIWFIEANKRITGMIQTQVGNYFRINETDIKKLIAQEVERQMPKEIESLVRGRLLKIAGKLLDEGKIDG